jgi:hypothetical protein
MFWQTFEINQTIPDLKDHFKIMKFELPDNVDSLNKSIDFWTDPLYPEREKFIINQLHIDYIFMSVIFPFVMVLCFRMRSRFISLTQGESNSLLAKLLLIFGFLQLLAWAFDFFENQQLEQWINAGEAGEITFFKALVISKFFIIIVGALLSVYTFVKTRNLATKNI